MKKQKISLIETLTATGELKPAEGIHSNLPGILYSLSHPKLTIEEIIESEDDIFSRHKNNNLVAATYIEKSLELGLNQSWYCTRNEACHTNKHLVFFYFYEDILSSLLNAYRISFWGATTDAYSILRTALEGLGFISQVIDEGDFDKVLELMNSKKLRHKYIVKRAFKDKNLHKEVMRLSDLSSHFTLKRLAQGYYEVNNTYHNRMGYSFYEQENDLTRRLGTFLNIIKYANSVLTRYIKHHHNDCGYGNFGAELTQLEELYSRLKEVKYPDDPQR